MAIKYLKKAIKTAFTDDTKTRDIVQNLLKELEKTLLSKNLWKDKSKVKKSVK